MKLQYIFLLFFGLSASSAFSYGWTQKADFGGEARHRTTMLAIGNKIYTGLGHYNGAGPNVLFDDWWEFDPATNAWTQKADYMGGICYHAAGFTIGNYGYVGTGRISPSGSTLVKDFFRYDPATNNWVQLTDFPGVGIRGGVAFELNGYGYMGTGQTSTGYTNTMYRYTPSTDSWISIASLPTGGRISAVAFSIEGKGYVGTGYDASVGWSTNDFYAYQPLNNTWSPIANAGPTTRMEASGFELNGKGYVLTGDNISSGTNYKDMWEYNVALNSWTQLEDFEGSARRYLSTISVNGVAYAGLGTNGTNFKDFWLFDQTASMIERNIHAVQLKTFPNPTKGELNISIQGLSREITEQLTVKIFDLTGKVVMEQKMESEMMSLNISSLNSGSYMCAIQYGEQLVKNEKITIL